MTQTNTQQNGPRMLSAPVLTGLIEGQAEIGTQLQVTPGAWAYFGPVTLSYQWYRNDVAIAGATSPAFVLTAADDMAQICCREQAGIASGTSEAETLTVTARYPAPQVSALPLDPDLPEVFDQGTGMQQIETAQAFTGQNLTFSAEGAAIDPVSGEIALSTQTAIDGLKIRVSARNSGGAVQQEMLVTIEGADEITMQSQITDAASGVTWYFVDASGAPELRETWLYADGSHGVLGGPGNPVRIGAITPARTVIPNAALDGRGNDLGDRIVHGTTLNPGRRVADKNVLPGWTNYRRRIRAGNTYDPAEDIDPGHTGQPIVIEEGLIAKSLCFTGTGVSPGYHNASVIERIGLLTVAPELPDTADALRPACAAPGKAALHRASDIRFDALPTDLDIAGIDYAPSYAEALERVRFFQSPFLHFEEGVRGTTAYAHQRDYSGDQVENLGQAALWLCDGGLSEAERLALAIPLVQYGIDIASKVVQGVTSRINGGHAIGERWIVYLAGKLLGHQPFIDMAALFNDPATPEAWVYGSWPQTPGAWSGDHFRYAEVPAQFLDHGMTRASRVAESYRPGAEAMPERWAEGLNGRFGTESWKGSNASPNEAYRTIVARDMGVVMTCYLMAGAVAELGGDVPIRYYDRFTRMIDNSDITMSQQTWSTGMFKFAFEALRDRIAIPVWRGQPEALPWRNRSQTSHSYIEPVFAGLRYVPVLGSDGAPLVLDNDSPILRWDARWRSGGSGSPWTEVQDLQWDGTGYLIPGAPRTGVLVELRVVNAQGPGPWSNSGHGSAVIGAVNGRFGRGSMVYFQSSGTTGWVFKVYDSRADFHYLDGLPIPGEVVTANPDGSGSSFTYLAPEALEVVSEADDIGGTFAIGDSVSLAPGTLTAVIGRLAVDGSRTDSLYLHSPAGRTPVTAPGSVVSGSGGGTAVLKELKTLGPLGNLALPAEP